MTRGCSTKSAAGKGQSATLCLLDADRSGELPNTARTKRTIPLNEISGLSTLAENIENMTTDELKDLKARVEALRRYL